ncbi:MAG TPA: hypothetical protein VHL34_04705 [Rhizomicrobium sp.]|jgi:hypothetical protein|nr:hypothetical protein [Rhizomicrobium sp.]
MPQEPDWIVLKPLRGSVYEEQVDRWSPAIRHRPMFDQKGNRIEAPWREGWSPTLAEQEHIFSADFLRKHGYKET